VARASRIQDAFDTSRAPSTPFEFWAFASAYSGVMRAIDDCAGLITLIGPPGSGKSTLLRTIQRARRRKRGLVFFRTKPTIGLDDLLASLLSELRIATISAARDYRLEALVAHLGQRWMPSVLLVDDAHLAPERALSGLAALAMYRAGDPASLQVVLAGESQLEDRLQRRSLSWIQEHVAARVQLDPLSADEVGGYIVHRIADARKLVPRAWGPRNPFVPEAVNQVARYSHGVPGTINRICRSALSNTRLEVDLAAVGLAAVTCGATPAATSEQDDAGAALLSSEPPSNGPEADQPSVDGLQASISRPKTRRSFRHVAYGTVALTAIAGAAAVATQPSVRTQILAQVDALAADAIGVAASVRDLIALYWPKFDFSFLREESVAVISADVAPVVRSVDFGSTTSADRRQAEDRPDARPDADERVGTLKDAIKAAPPSSLARIATKPEMWPPAPPARVADRDVSFHSGSRGEETTNFADPVPLNVVGSPDTGGSHVEPSEPKATLSRAAAERPDDISPIAQRLGARQEPVSPALVAADVTAVGSEAPRVPRVAAPDEEHDVTGSPLTAKLAMRDVEAPRANPSPVVGPLSPAIVELSESKRVAYETPPETSIPPKPAPPSAVSPSAAFPRATATERPAAKYTENAVRQPAAAPDPAPQETGEALRARPSSRPTFPDTGSRRTEVTPSPLAARRDEVSGRPPAHPYDVIPGGAEPKAEPPVPIQLARLPETAHLTTSVSVPTDRLMARGHALMDAGDPASARLLFERAAAQGDVGANLAIGQTFDPFELRRVGVIGMRGQPERALEWYRRAAAVGEPRAAALIARLETAAARP
jgi:type II secretory pathway predicted ATPase ExeA